MFRVRSATARVYRIAMAGLLTLSITSLAVTIWIMADFLKEQEIVDNLIQQLPPTALHSAEELAGELRWQFRLTILVVLNLIATGIAVILLWRAYRSSQESLRDLKSTAADILNSMSQAVITTDTSGRITSINRRAVEMLALTSDCIGQSLDSLPCGLPFDFSVRNGAPTERVIEFANRDGNTRSLRASSLPLTIHDRVERGRVIQFHDITERLLVDDRLRRMERYVGLGSVAAGLHHEIKNPLAALSLHAQLLEEELDGSDLAESARQMLSVIKAELLRVGKVLESFQDFASVDQLHVAENNINDLIDQQVSLIVPQAEAQKIGIRVSLAHDLPPIQADRVKLEQVILNLILNAIEAMPKGGELAVQTAYDPVGETVLVEIGDTGPGIQSDLQDRIFDPYFSTKKTGSGMGLALCDKIVRQHHGTIECDSSQSGTVFLLRLPLINRPRSSSDGRFEHTDR